MKKLAEIISPDGLIKLIKVRNKYELHTLEIKQIAGKFIRRWKFQHCTFGYRLAMNCLMAIDTVCYDNQNIHNKINRRLWIKDNFSKAKSMLIRSNAYRSRSNDTVFTINLNWN